MLIQLLIGAGLLAVCVIIHVTVLDIVAIRLRSIIAAYDFPLPQGLRLTILVGASLSVFLSHIVQVCIWATAFLAAGEFTSLETALYFSTVTFTALGYGDVVASSDWRLLASFEAATGLFLFGLSTAFLFVVLSNIWSAARKPT